VKQLVGSGLVDPADLSLNKSETLLFQSDYGDGFDEPGDVEIYKYPSGRLVRTLGASEGVNSPLGVSDAPNAAF
jgi:hypothetical protein